MGGVISCGTVGPPVPPQDIGVNIKRQKDARERERLANEAGQRHEPKEKEKTLEADLQEPVPPEQQAELVAPINPAIRPDTGIIIPSR